MVVADLLRCGASSPFQNAASLKMLEHSYQAAARDYIGAGPYSDKSKADFVSKN